MLITSVINRLPFGKRLLSRIRAFRLACAALRELGLNPYKRNVVFDVGANDGSSFSWLARAIPWLEVYAFEPTPQLLKKLHQQMGALGNYHIVPKAVGESVGIVHFNVAGQGDWGCSSTLEFSSGLDKTWPGRSDFRVTETITVDMIRLDHFVRSRNISQIDFLHIDTQGTDLLVLKSLGEEVARVRAGVIEVPQSREVMLYQGQHSREDAVSWLERNEFTIWKIVTQQNEDNLYFRKSSSPLKIS
jgi:FkbM family methyltransferase